MLFVYTKLFDEETFLPAFVANNYSGDAIQGIELAKSGRNLIRRGSYALYYIPGNTLW